MIQAVPIALVSALVFAALVVMRDRRRGASLAQGVIALAGAALILSIVREAGAFGVSAASLAGFATAVMAAALAGMLYHLYLGRFAQVWAARGVFALVFLVLAAVLGVLFGAVIG
jgi:hypothetical protein